MEMAQSSILRVKSRGVEMLVEVDVGEIHKGILTLHTVFDAPSCLQQTGKTYC